MAIPAADAKHQGRWPRRRAAGRPVLSATGIAAESIDRAGLDRGSGCISCLAPLRPYRFLGYSYIVCYTVIFLLHGKNYYLAPIYPMLLASGAIAIESAFAP